MHDAYLLLFRIIGIDQRWEMVERFAASASGKGDELVKNNYE